jgi:hypothetical protein
VSSDRAAVFEGRALICVPMDVVEPLGIRERLAGVGQMLGLLACREAGDRDGQAQLRQWFDVHPMGAAGLVAYLAQRACEALTGRRGEQALAQLRFMTMGRLSAGYRDTIAGLEGWAGQESMLDSYGWATLLTERVLVGDVAGREELTDRMTCSPEACWGAVLGLADLVLAELRLSWDPLSSWFERVAAESLGQAEAAVADRSGAWTATGGHAGLPHTAPAVTTPPVGPEDSVARWARLESRFSDVTAVVVGYPQVPDPCDRAWSVGVALGSALLVTRERQLAGGHRGAPLRLVEDSHGALMQSRVRAALLREPTMAPGMISLLGRRAHVTCREVLGPYAGQATQADCDQVRQDYERSDPTSMWARGWYLAHLLLVHHTRGDLTQIRRVEAQASESGELAWGTALGLAELTIAYARHGLDDSAAWIHLLRSLDIAVTALGQP